MTMVMHLMELAVMMVMLVMVEAVDDDDHRKHSYIFPPWTPVRGMTRAVTWPRSKRLFFFFFNGDYLFFTVGTALLAGLEA